MKTREWTINDMRVEGKTFQYVLDIVQKSDPNYLYEREFAGETVVEKLYSSQVIKEERGLEIWIRILGN